MYFGFRDAFNDTKLDFGDVKANHTTQNSNWDCIFKVDRI
jgi:hypothetical protein